jgi:hypothetical protein
MPETRDGQAPTRQATAVQRKMLYRVGISWE